MTEPDTPKPKASRARIHFALLFITALVLGAVVYRGMDLGPTAGDKFEFLKGQRPIYRDVRRPNGSVSRVGETYNIHMSIGKFAKEVAKFYPAEMKDHGVFDESAPMLLLDIGSDQIGAFEGKTPEVTLAEYMKNGIPLTEPAEGWVTVHCTHDLEPGFWTSCHNIWESIKEKLSR